MMVIGMGERKTPKPFIAACNMFRYLTCWPPPMLPFLRCSPLPRSRPPRLNPLNPPTRLGPPCPCGQKKTRQKKPAAPTPTPQEDPDLTAMRAAIRAIVAEQSDEDDWMGVSMIGNILVKRHPDFDVRNFGFSKLTPFVKSLGIFEVKTEQNKDHTHQAYVRIK